MNLYCIKITIKNTAAIIVAFYIPVAGIEVTKEINSIFQYSIGSTILGHTKLSLYLFAIAIAGMIITALDINKLIKLVLISILLIIFLFNPAIYFGIACDFYGNCL